MSEGKAKTWLSSAKLVVVEVTGAILIIIGIILLCLHIDVLGKKYEYDYTDCNSYEDQSIKCKDTFKETYEPCSCMQKINIPEPMEANVTVLYDLESYDQSSYYQSRDDKQLFGELSMTPSHTCDPYTYVNTTEGSKPIAPCGAIADSMFNDTYMLQINKTYLPMINTGLVSEADKLPYHNPPGDLQIVFQNYSKPINWRKNVWELDTTNPANNGFQNERFIAWMKTDLKPKPAWRVNHTGIFKVLPAGDYVLRVEYAYSPSRYEGKRKVIISNEHSVVNPVKLGFGITFLLLGVIVVVGKVLYNRKTYGNYIACEKKSLDG